MTEIRLAVIESSTAPQAVAAVYYNGSDRPAGATVMLSSAFAIKQWQRLYRRGGRLTAAVLPDGKVSVALEHDAGLYRHTTIAHARFITRAVHQLLRGLDMQHFSDWVRARRKGGQITT